MLHIHKCLGLAYKCISNSRRANPNKKAKQIRSDRFRRETDIVCLAAREDRPITHPRVSPDLYVPEQHSSGVSNPLRVRVPTVPLLTVREFVQFRQFHLKSTDKHIWIRRNWEDKKKYPVSRSKLNF